MFDLANFGNQESYPKPLAIIILASWTFLASAVVGSKSWGSVELLVMIALALPYFPKTFCAIFA